MQHLIPLNRRGVQVCPIAVSVLHALLDRILDVLDLVELDIA
jgi:hypothetical protein